MWLHGISGSTLSDRHSQKRDKAYSVISRGVRRERTRERVRRARGPRSTGDGRTAEFRSCEPVTCVIFNDVNREAGLLQANVQSPLKKRSSTTYNPHTQHVSSFSSVFLCSDAIGIRLTHAFCCCCFLYSVWLLRAARAGCCGASTCCTFYDTSSQSSSSSTCPWRVSPRTSCLCTCPSCPCSCRRIRSCWTRSGWCSHPRSGRGSGRTHTGSRPSW